MEIWVDHYYADHLKEGVMLYAPYIQSGAYDIEEVQKINDIADRLGTVPCQVYTLNNKN